MRNLLHATALAFAASGLTAIPAASQQTRPASAADVKIPVSDARNIGPGSVRFSATQFTKTAPVVVIFGMTKASWPKLNAAIQQAVFDGYPVDSIFIGSQDAPPALEIYAKGHHVSVDGINPNTITGPELTRLIKAVVREYYR